MEIYVKKILMFAYFLFSSGFQTWFLYDALILPVSQLQTQQVMTSRIRSHRIFNSDLLYSCAQFVVEIDEKSSHNGEI